jgi:peptidyl-prolyl cis-trans isomerase D
MPFETFRRYQKPMLAVFALMAMFVFVVSDSLMNYLGSRPDGQVDDEVVATLYGKEVKASRIGEMANQRAYANDFVTKLLSLKLASAQIGLPVPQTIFGATDDRSIVDAVILEAEADRLGIPIDVEATKTWLREAPVQILLQSLGLGSSEVTMRTFRDRIGTVTSADLDMTYQTFFASRVPDQYLLNSIGNQLRLLQVRTLGGGTEVSPLDVYELYKDQAETVSVNAVAFPVDAYLTKTGEPSEADLKALYEKGKETEPVRTQAVAAFKIPRRVQVEAVSADSNAVAARISSQMTEEKIVAAYESRKESDFSLPPLSPEERLRLSPLPQDVFQGDAEAKLTPKGPADVAVPPAPPEGPRFRSLDEVRTSLVEELSRDEARAEIDRKFAEIREEVMNPFADSILAVEEENEAAKDEGQPGDKPLPKYDSAKLVDAVKKLELTYEKTSAISKEEASAPDAVLELGAIADARLGTEIGDLGENFTTEIFSDTFREFTPTLFTTIGGRRYMIWKIADEAPRVPTFEEAKPTVEAYWKLEKAREMAEKDAKAFAEAVKAKGGDLKAVADEQKKTIVVTAPTSKVVPSSFSATVRDGSFVELNEPGKALMDAAFALGEKDVTVQPNATTRFYYVIGLGARKPVAPEQLYGAAGPFPRLVQTAMSDAEMKGRDEWMKSLRKKAGLPDDWTPPSERESAKKSRS